MSAETKDSMKLMFGTLGFSEDACKALVEDQLINAPSTLLEMDNDGVSDL